VSYDEDEDFTMSVIEDTRKVMQDFLAPELRAISVRLDALEKQLIGVDKHFEDSDQRAENSERRSEKRHDELLSAIARMSDISDLRERMARLEAKDRPHQ
jgi:hypothetical protein